MRQIKFGYVASVAFILLSIHLGLHIWPNGITDPGF